MSGQFKVALPLDMGYIHIHIYNIPTHTYIKKMLTKLQGF